MSLQRIRRYNDDDRQRLQKFFNSHLHGGDQVIIPTLAFENQFRGGSALIEYIDDGVTVAAVYLAPEYVEYVHLNDRGHADVAKLFLRYLLNIEAIAVHENYRHSGLARALLEEVEALAVYDKQARRGGASFIFGFVEQSNDAARNFFARAGYKIFPVGESVPIPLAVFKDSVDSATLDYGVNPDPHYSVILKQRGPLPSI